MIVIIIALTTLPLLALHRRRIRSELGIISFTIKNSLKLRQAAAAATTNAHVITIRESLAVQVSLVGTMIIIIFIRTQGENENKVGS